MRICQRSAGLALVIIPVFREKEVAHPVILYKV